MSSCWEDLQELQREFSASLDRFEELLRRRAAGENVTDELNVMTREQHELQARVQEWVEPE